MYKYKYSHLIKIKLWIYSLRILYCIYSACGEIVCVIARIFGNVYNKIIVFICLWNVKNKTFELPQNVCVLIHGIKWKRPGVL